MATASCIQHGEGIVRRVASRIKRCIVHTMIGALESNHTCVALRLILKGLHLVTTGLKAKCAARLAAHLAKNPELQSSQPWAAAAFTKVSNMFRNIPKPTLTAPHTPNQHDAHPLAPPQLARSCDDMPNPDVVDTMPAPQPAPHDNSRRVLFATLDDLTKDPDAVNYFPDGDEDDDDEDGDEDDDDSDDDVDFEDLLGGRVGSSWMVELMMTPPSTPVAP